VGNDLASVAPVPRAEGDLAQPVVEQRRFAMISAVRRARPIGLATIAAEAASGSAASLRPIASAWATPRGVSGESRQPW
jgi:hypothetical protein